MTQLPAKHSGSFVDFAFEASILVAGNGKDYVTFPIVRNEHRNNILHMTIAPAEVDETVAKEAHELALRLAKGFELAGILAIELFITKDNKVIVNELAPRPHNSGHYTIEACSFDQFDAHIRGIAGWPLEQPQLLKPAVMVNVLGQHVGADPCAHRRPSRMERARLLQGGSAPRPQDGTHHRADRRHRQNRSRP